ncbi:hypothetical protein CsSME_00040513 [Camellia sinensis var. sinensis]
MATQKPVLEQQQSQMLRVKNSGLISINGSPVMEDREEEMTRSALSAFRAKEEEIERKTMEVKEKVQAQLGRVEEETKRLAEIREVSTSISPHDHACVCVFGNKNNGKLGISFLFFANAVVTKFWVPHNMLVLHFFE